jgi:hypothetical protein
VQPAHKILGASLAFPFLLIRTAIITVPQTLSHRLSNENYPHIHTRSTDLQRNERESATPPFKIPGRRAVSGSSDSDDSKGKRGEGERAAKQKKWMANRLIIAHALASSFATTNAAVKKPLARRPVRDLHARPKPTSVRARSQAARLLSISSCDCIPVLPKTKDSAERRSYFFERSFTRRASCVRLAPSRRLETARALHAAAGV